jgi:hypothetical protein
MKTEWSENHYLSAARVSKVGRQMKKKGVFGWKGQQRG